MTGRSRSLAGLSAYLCKRPLHRFGTRPSNTIVKWFSAATQSLIGRAQGADAFWIARYSTLRTESGFGLGSLLSRLAGRQFRDSQRLAQRLPGRMAREPVTLVAVLRAWSWHSR